MTRSVLGGNPQRAGNEIQVLGTIDPSKSVVLNNNVKIIFKDTTGATDTMYITVDTDNGLTLVGDVITIQDDKIAMPDLPTSDPAVAGRLWRSGNDLKISTG